MVGRIKVVKPELFHHAVMLFNGRKVQMDKVKEELLELKQALAEGNRDHIVEELADVEVVLPYLTMIYMSGYRFEIKRTGELDYSEVCDILLIVFDYYLKTQMNVGIYGALIGVTQCLCESLFNVYAKYQITQEEIHDWKIKKKARTIARKVKEIIHV